MDNKKIGAALRRARERAGFRTASSFVEYAKSRGLEIEYRTYANYEQGRRALTAEMIFSLADLLNCTCDQVIGRYWPESHPEKRLSADGDYSIETRRFLKYWDGCNSEQRLVLTSTAKTFAESNGRDGSLGRAEDIGLQDARSA